MSYQSYPMATVAAHERFDYFQSVVDGVFSPMQLAPHSRDVSGFRAQVEVAALGDLRLARVASSPVTVQRREAEVGRLRATPYLVKFQLRGESLWRQRGREVHLKPGDFVIASMAEPYQLVLPGEYEMPVLALDPKTMRHLDPDPERFLGHRMSGQDADCGLLSSFVAQVVSRMDRLREPMISRVEANILDLLGAVLAARSATATLRAARPFRPVARSPGGGAMMGPGMMMMGGGRGADMCGPRAAGLAEWRLDRIERAAQEQEAIARARDLRFAPFRPARLRRGSPCEDVEMRPAFRTVDELAQE